MAATLTKVDGPYNVGGRWQTIYTLACDNSYPTGGYSVTPANLGFAATADPSFVVEINDTKGYAGLYDYTNLKVMFYTSAGTQTTNATDLSALTAVRLVATGKYRG